MLNGIVLIEPFHVIQSETSHAILMVLEDTLLLVVTLGDRHSILILHMLFWKQIIVDVLLIRIYFFKHISSLDDRFH